MILSKFVSEYHSFISLREEKTSHIVHLDFFMVKKLLNLLKKRHGHNFAIIHSIINQNESTHMPVMLIGCGNFWSIILGVSFFFNKLFQSEILLFSKIKKKYFQAFFLWKNGIGIVFFSFKKVYWPFFQSFSNKKKMTFFDLFWPFKSFYDLKVIWNIA